MDPEKSFKIRKFIIALIVVFSFLGYGAVLFFIEFPAINRDAIVGIGATLGTLVVLAIKEYLDGTPDSNNSNDRKGGYPPRGGSSGCNYPKQKND